MRTLFGAPLHRAAGTVLCASGLLQFMFCFYYLLGNYMAEPHDENSISNNTLYFKMVQALITTFAGYTIASHDSVAERAFNHFYNQFFHHIGYHQPVNAVQIARDWLDDNVQNEEHYQLRH